jgi:hypothetical protein
MRRLFFFLNFSDRFNFEKIPDLFYLSFGSRQRRVIPSGLPIALLLQKLFT